MSTSQHSPVPQHGKLVSVVPVGLKEAALDSPTFRASTLHIADQIEFIERWLDGYAKSAAKFTAELSTFESITNTFLAYTTNPINVSEAVLDHDFTLQAMKRYGDSAREIWTGMITTIRKLDQMVVEPIKAFIQEDLRNFKETRRILDHTQKQYDHLLARYSGQAKTKEPSALREDAFQLHEARKAYLKASMDFCVQAPQLRNALDRLMVRISFDQWREARTIHDAHAAMFAKASPEMDRIKGWIHEMETSERNSRRELLSARKQIEDAAEHAARPSRELEDYSVSTVPYLGSRGPPSLKLSKEKGIKPEKQGWLYLRTLTGKPTRTVWVRRWAFLKNGIFGCLVQGSRTGGVEESERIGVLLCSIRPAFQEERRFCFEVKTKNNTITLQAESQKELMEWINSFEAAKQKALENPASTDLSVSGKVTVQDPAFSISQPPAPEFAADPSESLTPNANDEPPSMDRNGSLPVPEREGLAMRSSTEIHGGGRRLTGDREESSGRDHAARIIQKLDLHRKSNTTGPSSPMPPSGGIASLISASHSILPLPVQTVDDGKGRSYNLRDAPPTSLAPPTLANPPAPTSMSKACVIVSNERGIGLGFSDNTGGMPSGMMANLWGSSNWGFVNKLEREKAFLPDIDPVKRPGSPLSDSSKNAIATDSEVSSDSPSPAQRGPRHRQTVSLDGDAAKLQRAAIGVPHEYPSYYPQLLRTQDAQFRLLFPNVGREESLLLVFRATWSPNDQQEFPGRAYVTTRNIYFYSHYYGLVLTTSVQLSGITEVTAAPGRDCDFLFLHIAPPIGQDTPGRITIKTFLEPLRLLQKRINFLISEATAEEPLSLEAILKTMIKMESEGPSRTLSVDSWEDVSISTPADASAAGDLIPGKPGRDLRAPIYIDKDLELDSTKARRGKDVAKFRLPAQPVQYVPQGNLELAAERVLEISPKALFHVLFGDKSAVWQMLLKERRVHNIKQGPWVTSDSRHMRRDMSYQIETTDILGRTRENKVSDYQIIDVLNDHLCYVVTDKRTAWHLPFRRSFRLVSKIVITYVAKSRSKLAVYTKVEWLWSPYVLKNIIDKQALVDLEQDALDLLDLVSDQVRRLGPHSRTKRAITIFGQVGHQKEGFELPPDASSKLGFRKSRRQRTLMQLVSETFLSFLESAVSSVMLWTFALLRWAWKTTRANTVILALLFASLLINGFYSSRDTFDWWHERNAGKFMARLGVGPNNVMSKAIYLRDIDEAIANNTVWRVDGNNSNSCFSTFHEQTLVNYDLPLTLTSTNPRDAISKSAARRLQETRERLGMYRHDLIVALRVVNSVEREVLQNEWERWLQQETRRCRQVELLLNQEDETGEVDVDSNPGASALFGEHRDEIRHLYEDYCKSCLQEQERIDENRSGVELGRTSVL
ncbi:SNF1-interacting protein [Paecilomyces lecythidis]